jgi:hypothetical protein
MTATSFAWQIGMRVSSGSLPKTFRMVCAVVPVVGDGDADRPDEAGLLQRLQLVHPVAVVTPGRPVQVQLHEVDAVQTEVTQRRLAALGHPALREGLLHPW